MRVFSRKEVNRIMRIWNSDRTPDFEKFIDEYSEAIFENIKYMNEYGQEFWYARELQEVLEYSQWKRFKDVIFKAKEACKNSNNLIEEHFADVDKMIVIGNGGERENHVGVGFPLDALSQRSPAKLPS